MPKLTFEFEEEVSYEVRYDHQFIDVTLKHHFWYWFVIVYLIVKLTHFLKYFCYSKLILTS